jgi:hypothetical protein
VRFKRSVGRADSHGTWSLRRQPQSLDALDYLAQQSDAFTDGLHEGLEALDRLGVGSAGE